MAGPGCMHLINCLHVHQLLKRQGQVYKPPVETRRVRWGSQRRRGMMAGYWGEQGIAAEGLLIAGASTGLWEPLGVRTWVGEGGRGIPSFNGTPTRWFWRDAPLDPPGSCGPTIVGEALRSLPAVSSCTPRAAVLVVLAHPAQQY